MTNILQYTTIFKIKFNAEHLTHHKTDLTLHMNALNCCPYARVKIERWQTGKRKSSLTLWQVWWDIWHFLGVDVRPVKVIIRVLLVITLWEAFIECTTSWNRRNTKHLADVIETKPKLVESSLFYYNKVFFQSVQNTFWLFIVCLCL